MKSTITNENGQLKSITGRDGMDVMRIRTLMLAIKCLVDTNGRMQVTRGWNMKRCLESAAEYTGNKYKRSEGQRRAAGYGRAAKDNGFALATYQRSGGIT